MKPITFINKKNSRAKWTTKDRNLEIEPYRFRTPWMIKHETKHERNGGY